MPKKQIPQHVRGVSQSFRNSWSDWHNRGKKSTMTDPVGKIAYTLKNISGEFQERKTELSKNVSVSYFNQHECKDHLRVGVTRKINGKQYPGRELYERSSGRLSQLEFILQTTTCWGLLCPTFRAEIFRANLSQILSDCPFFFLDVLVDIWSLLVSFRQCYHSFRNHYILNAKKKSGNCNCREISKIPERSHFLQLHCARKTRDCNCNANLFGSCNCNPLSHSKRVIFSCVSWMWEGWWTKKSVIIVSPMVLWTSSW